MRQMGVIGWAAFLVLTACSDLTPSATALRTAGETVRFQAADAEGPWADITLTRLAQPAVIEPPGPRGRPTDEWVEFEVTYEILRDRDIPYATLVDWTAYGRHNGIIAPNLALDWSLESPGHPRLPQALGGAKAGERLHGYFIVAVLSGYDETWLAFTPMTERASTIPTPDWESVERRWLIAD